MIIDGDDGSIGNDGFEIRQSLLENGVDVFDLRGREAQGNQRGLSRFGEGHESGRLRKNYCGKVEIQWRAHLGQQENRSENAQKGRSARPQRAKMRRRTLRYVELLSEARTPLADFFSILLVNRMANTEAGEAMIVAISGDPFAAALNDQSGQERVRYEVALNPHYS